MKFTNANCIYDEAYISRVVYVKYQMVIKLIKRKWFCRRCRRRRQFCRQIWKAEWKIKEKKEEKTRENQSFLKKGIICSKCFFFVHSILNLELLANLPSDYYNVAWSAAVKNCRTLDISSPQFVCICVTAAQITFFFSLSLSLEEL